MSGTSGFGQFFRREQLEEIHDYRQLPITVQTLAASTGPVTPNFKFICLYNQLPGNLAARPANFRLVIFVSQERVRGPP
jgi:hypothetical protein